LHASSVLRRIAWGTPGREVDFAALIDNDGTFQRHPHGLLEDEVAVLQYTGGTTGEPKGAMLTHANLCAVLNIFNHWDQHSRSEEPDKALAVLPLFHIFGLTFIMLLVVANGAEMVLHIKFDPDRVLTDISALHRRHSLVRQMLHEHAAVLSAASPANRSRRLIKCAKESARYRDFREVDLTYEFTPL
jgi:long-chain acyl-CoA synthetase